MRADVLTLLCSAYREGSLPVFQPSIHWVFAWYLWTTSDRGLMPLDRATDGGEYEAAHEWLHQVFHDTAFQAHGGRNGVDGSCEDDGDRGETFAQLAHKPEAVVSRHLDIAEDDIGALGGQGLKGRIRIRRFSRVVPSRRQPAHENLSHRTLIID